MAQLKIFVVMLTAAAALAAPTWGGSSPAPCPSTNVNANFDDITANGVTPLGVYQGLYYQAFTPNAYNNPGGLLPDIEPHTPPNYIYTGIATQTTSGTPMLTVNYANSKVTSFTLKSFFFGVQLSAQNPASNIPSDGYVQVTGYVGSDNSVSAAQQKCSQQFQYHPTTQTGVQQMAFSGPLLSCFQDISFAIINFNLPGGTASLTSDSALALDSLAYSYKTC